MRIPTSRLTGEHIEYARNQAAADDNPMLELRTFPDGFRCVDCGDWIDEDPAGHVAGCPNDFICQECIDGHDSIEVEQY